MKWDGNRKEETEKEKKNCSFETFFQIKNEIQKVIKYKRN